MPHVDRARLFAFLVVGGVYMQLFAFRRYRCLSVHSVPRRRTGEGGRERVGGNVGGGIREGGRGALSSRLHRSAAGGPHDRSTANKSRRFLRRAARVRSCPAFRIRSVSVSASLAANAKGEEAKHRPTTLRSRFKLFLARWFSFCQDDGWSRRFRALSSSLHHPSALYHQTWRWGGKERGSFNSLNILLSGFFLRNSRERGIYSGIYVFTIAINLAARTLE